MAAVCLLSIFWACNSGANRKEMSAGTDMSAQQAPEMAMAKGADGAQEAPKEVKVATERKLIREGEIGFETGDVAETRTAILKAVKDMGGYIGRDEAMNQTDRQQHTMLIRVTSEKFDELLAAVSKNASRIESQNIRVLDVTEEYIDVEARVKTKKELEARYMALLQKAAKVEEILNIERELANLRSEIESIEGRLKFLKDQVSYSSLTVNFYERTTASYGFWSKIGSAVKNGWNLLMALLVGMVNIWPVILIIAAAVFLLVRYERRKRRAK